MQGYDPTTLPEGYAQQNFLMATSSIVIGNISLFDAGVGMLSLG